MSDTSFLGAVASNAGDEFHVLWAAREMLRMVDRDESIVAVGVEGLPRDDVHNQVGEHGQAADVVLVRDVEGVESFHYLQLKHSSSDPDANWTWDRLLRRRSKTNARSSVLGKIAGLLKEVRFRGGFGIVTNQPLSDDVRADLGRLRSRDTPPSKGDGALIAQLARDLKLTRQELVGFLDAWDLSGFRTSSRSRMEGDILDTLSVIHESDVREDLTILKDRVAKLMLPESRNDPPIQRELLLLWLGIADETMLHPAPSRLKMADPYLRREAMGRLAAAVAAATSKPLRIHAGGGCGKTSMLYDLNSVLPSGSETLLYDCYGGGMFLASDERRHLPSRAFVQVANELAARFRIPPVTGRAAANDLFGIFRRRVGVAARLLEGRAPEALLVLCFDAVDNARKGSIHWGDECFLDLLSQASGWPGNVRIVVSCRTARRQEVGGAALYEDFEVGPFEASEVSDLIEFWQPSWPGSVATAIHDLTGGNPRRIVYAVEDIPSNAAGQAIERLMPKAEGIDPLFERRISDAGRHLGDEGKVWNVLDALARLPRPVPERILAQLANVGVAEIRDIATDVGGIVERDGGWSFADEDFEAFVVDRKDGAGDEVVGRAADLLFDLRFSDRYAATSVAEVLVSAGRLQVLYGLVVDEDLSSSPLSTIEAQFVQSRRLGSAIRCCRDTADVAAACGLLIASADAIGRARLLEDLIVQNLDLSVRFAPEEADRLAMSGSRHRDRRARIRIERARLTAKDRPEAARIDMRWWRAYLRDPPSGDRRNAGFTNEDIASEYEATAELHGEDVALRHLLKWRPRTILLGALRVLATRAAGRSGAALRRAIAARRWPPSALVTIMSSVLLSGLDPSAPEMRSGLERLSRTSPSRLRSVTRERPRDGHVLSEREAMLFVLERAVTVEEHRPLVVAILKHAFPIPPMETASDLHALRTSGARHARAHALRDMLEGTVTDAAQALPPERKVPPRTRGSGDGSPDESPDEEWNRVLRATVVAYGRMVDAARATLLGVLRGPTVHWPSVERSLDVSRSYRTEEKRNPDQVLLLIRNHLMHAALAGDDVGPLVNAAMATLADWSSDTLRQAEDIAGTLALVPAAHDAALQLLQSLPELISGLRVPGGDKAKAHCRWARTALPLDPDLSQWLFEEGVLATKVVDFEAQSALSAAGAIANSGLSGPGVDTPVLAARLVDSVGSVVESLGLRGDYDWSTAAGWVATIDARVALAAAVRWHDRDIVPFDRSLPPILAATDALALPHRTALGMLMTDEETTEDDRSAAGQPDVRPVPGWLAHAELETLSRSGEALAFIRGFKRIERVASDDAVPVLDTFRPSLDVVSSWAVATDDGSGTLDGSEDWDTTDDEIEPLPSVVDAAAIERALSAGARAGGIDADDILRVARAVHSRNLRVPFLEAAMAASAGRAGFGEALPVLMEEWSDYPPVRRWAGGNVPGYVVDAVEDLLDWRHGDLKPLAGALRACGLQPLDEARVLLDGILGLGDGIRLETLYVLTGMVAERAPEKARPGLFLALLDRVDMRTPHRGRVELGNAWSDMGVDESVACMLYGTMGDMDRRMRWRAAHAGLLLFRARDPAWEHLAQCLLTEGARIFKGEPFYGYGAAEQLLMVMQRASLEAPDGMAQHVDVLLERIREEPHLIVRELGRDILKRIALTASPPILSKQDLAYVDGLNRPRTQPVPRRPPPERPIARRDDRKRGYSFDDMDAIPYWYRPLATMFDMPMAEFLDRLEHRLTTLWGYGPTTAHWDQEPRLDRLRRLDGLTSRRHGSSPTVERLSHHVEWHAMMCLAGELIQERPLVGDDDIVDRFAEWTSRHLPTHGPRWLCDLRTPPPLEPRFWGAGPENGVSSNWNPDKRLEELLEWSRSMDASTFATEIATSNGFVVAGDFRVRIGNALMRVQTDSALVSPWNALSLAKSLVGTRSLMRLALPDGRYRDNLNASAFHLEAWLARRETSPRADRFDERRGEVSGIPLHPTGPARRMGLVFDASASGWRSAAGDMAIELAQWGGEEAQKGYGWRATARRDFLLDLLAATGRSLILEVTISCKLTEDVPTRIPERWMSFVVDADGSMVHAERVRRDPGGLLVRRMGLQHEFDTLGRWMLYRLAELAELRATSSIETRHELDREAASIGKAFASHRSIS